MTRPTEHMILKSILPEAKRPPEKALDSVAVRVFTEELNRLFLVQKKHINDATDEGFSPVEYALMQYSRLDASGVHVEENSPLLIFIERILAEGAEPPLFEMKISRFGGLVISGFIVNDKTYALDLTEAHNERLADILWAYQYDSDGNLNCPCDFAVTPPKPSHPYGLFSAHRVVERMSVTDEPEEGAGPQSHYVQASC